MWNREKIIHRVYWTIDRFGKIDPQHYKQVYAALQKLPPTTQFEILYTILIDCGNPRPHYGYQNFAGRLLFDLQPPCPLDAHDAICTLVTRCDRSVEQVPWYFACQFGKQTVLDSLAHLKTVMSSQQDLIYIDTWEWWIRGWDEYNFTNS